MRWRSSVVKFPMSVREERRAKGTRVKVQDSFGLAAGACQFG